MSDYITPKISTKTALESLSSPPSLLKKKKNIERIELFYLPSYILDVQVKTEKEIKIQSLCVDAVLGSFAFFEFAETTSEPHLPFSTCPFFLEEEIIRSKAVEEYRRHLLHAGLKMRYKFQIEPVVGTRPIHYPFWIGYFRRRRKIDFDVIDAVGGEHQGVAMRPVFMKALLFSSTS